MKIRGESRMTNSNFISTLSFLIFICFLGFPTQYKAYCQKTEQELSGLVEEFQEKYLTDYREAVFQATQMGWPVREEFPDGTIIEIQRLSDNGMPVYYITHNLNAARTVSTDDIWPGGLAGLSLSGNGMTIGEWDGGAVRVTHQELTGRATQVDGAPTLSWHSTHVGGTLIATGTYSPAKGMSYQAQLDAYDWNSDNAEMLNAAGNGLLISNHSYGYTRGWSYNSTISEWFWYGTASISATEDYSFGFYDSNSQTWDDIAFNRPYYLIVKSAGNDRDDAGPGPSGGHYYWNGGWVWGTTTRDPDGGTTGYDCIGQQGVAKNILTVGAVDDIPAGYSIPSDMVMSIFSSWGPADDGRIKPDIVANGVDLISAHSDANNSYAIAGGTSMSSPNAAGSLLLLQQHFQNLNSGSSMRSATLKGLVIHTADEAGSSDGPDYAFGWGLLNTANSIEVITNDGYEHHILEENLNNGNSFSKIVYSEGVSPLIATMCWTDPPGTPPSASLDPTKPMLVNDLDIRLSNSTPYYPWKLDVSNPANAATQADNSVDNVEKISVDSPSRGLYTLNVTHKGTLQNGHQEYSLIISDAYNTLTHTIPSGDPAAQDFANMDVMMDFSSSPGGDVTVATIPNSPPNAGGATISKYWDLSSSMINGAFMTDMEFSYEDTDVVGLNEDALVPVYYDDSESRWKRLLNYVLDQAGNTLTVHNLDHFTIFAIGEMDAFNFVETDIKVFLEGPYNGSNMSTELSSDGYIPLSQPFSGSPRNYSGQETVGEMAFSTVDWVLVELRTGIEPATKVTIRAALLQSDGIIVDLDGISPISFDDVTAGDYYIVLYHRNHISVMSSDAMALSGGSSSLYDFTTGIGQYYGGGGAKDLGSDVWGMISGDGNCDGGVFGEDYVLYQANQGSEGYKAADFNMDGGVLGEDYVIYQLNQGQQTSVP